MNNLLHSGAITKSHPSHQQCCSPIFLADKPNGTKRFILNLKYFNTSVVCPHFKMKDLRTAVKLVHKNIFMTTIDLKDAYFTVPIHKDHQKFRKFKFEGQLYQFTCLPFGLSSAPFCFSKLMKPVVSYLRSLGISNVNYLDDLLIFGASYQVCLYNTSIVLNLLKSLGFIINREKSVLIPTTYIKFLGFFIDSVSLKIELPDTKKNTITNFFRSHPLAKSLTLIGAKLLGKPF